MRYRDPCYVGRACCELAGDGGWSLMLGQGSVWKRGEERRVKEEWSARGTGVTVHHVKESFFFVVQFCVLYHRVSNVTCYPLFWASVVEVSRCL